MDLFHDFGSRKESRRNFKNFSKSLVILSRRSGYGRMLSGHQSGPRNTLVVITKSWTGVKWLLYCDFYNWDARNLFFTVSCSVQWRNSIFRKRCFAMYVGCKIVLLPWLWHWPLASVPSMSGWLNIYQAAGWVAVLHWAVTVLSSDCTVQL